MRADLLIPLTAIGEYWYYTLETNPDSGEITQVYSKMYDLKLMITEAQGTRFAFSRERMEFNGQLRNVRDPKGTVILDTEAGNRFFFLGTPMAQMDVFGNIMGYKYSITSAPVGSRVSAPVGNN